MICVSPVRTLLIGTATLALVVTQLVTAQEEDATPAPEDAKGVLAGHSYHGEVFNEGPRQKAYLMEGTGKVHLEVSTEIPDVQAFFNQGVGQLHGFWYFEAERSFRQVAALDPDCAMAYWGMAMANFQNRERAKGFIEEAVKRKENASEREQLWIQGYADYVKSEEKDEKTRKRAYIRGLESLIHDYPDEVEAKAFLAVRLWQFNGTLPISSYEAVSALEDQIFAAAPLHPAYHYRIHLWDNEKPQRALEAAAQCGQVSPGIAHMWHMPGHIYSRLKRYADSAWQQEASARVDHAQMQRDRLLPDQISNYAHNNEWLIRNLIHVGRAKDAIGLAKNLIELPRHPRHNTLSRSGRSASYGRSRLFTVLKRFELWDEILALSSTVYLEPTDIPKQQTKRRRALGRAFFGKDDRKGLRVQISRIEKRLSVLNAGLDGEIEKAECEARSKASEEEKSEEDITKAVEKARERAERDFDRRKSDLDRPLAELRLYDALLDSRRVTVRDLLTDEENKAGLDKVTKSKLFLRIGDQEEASRLAREAVEEGENEVLPLANSVEVLWECGKRDDARAMFDQLRELSARIDIDMPPFARLTTIAKELGHETDWRVKLKVPEDVGDRPNLDELGPFRWQPQPALTWTLPDGIGGTVSLSDFKGTAVVVIFFLGAECTHCVEQLNAFSPRVSDFEAHGISMVSISTESTEKVQQSLVAFDADDGDFRIPILADPELNVFKLYRAYDDFESQPLHGTFLIDAQGLVQWHDISYEPFTDPDFLLRESRRLLGESETFEKNRKVQRF